MKEQPMSDEKTMGQVIQIDEARIRDHLSEMVRGAVEETLNAMLDAEADRLCGAARYERSQVRQDTRAGCYERTLHTKAADIVEQTVHETLTYNAFPDIHWQKIRTNNPLERIMREIRRRTRVVGAFPDGQSCLNLAAARLRYVAGSAWSAKRYMNMRPLYQMQSNHAGAVA
jgi:transposase-like protein